MTDIWVGRACSVTKLKYNKKEKQKKKRKEKKETEFNCLTFPTSNLSNSGIALCQYIV